MKTLTQKGLYPGQEVFAVGRRVVLVRRDFCCFNKRKSIGKSEGGQGGRCCGQLKICRKNEVFDIEFDVFGNAVGAIVAVRFRGRPAGEIFTAAFLFHR